MTLSNAELLNEYFHQRHQELSVQLTAKKAIFLDTKGWVHLRQAAFGDPTCATWLPVLELLRQLTASQQIFCPVSFTTVIEVLKQSDDRTREATANLLDELSLGIGFCAPDEQIIIEVDRQARIKTGSPERDLSVWTRTCLTFMRDRLLDMKFSLPEQFPLFEACFNEVWNTPISKFIKNLGHTPTENLTATVARLNSDNEAHRDEIKTFNALLESECIGAARFASRLTHTSVRPHIARKLAASGLSRFLAESPDEELETQAVIAWVVEALQTVEGRLQLPSLFTYAAIHAQIRWMRTQKLRDNDLPDHAQVGQAIGYCDALLLDRATRNVVVAPQIRLDQLYGTRIMTTPEEFSTYLQGLAFDT